MVPLRTRARLLRSSNTCKLQYKVDVTLVPYRRDGPFFQICCNLQYEINIFPAMGPRMIFGPNLQHMAPFGIPTTVFCMVFQHATLVFSIPGLIFRPRDLDLGSGWAGEFFCKKGPGIRDFVEEMVPHGV